MTLTATWLKGQNPLYDLPISIVWEDGRPATSKEFHAHHDDTQVREDTDGRQQIHIYPEIVAQVYYCPFGRVWGMHGTE